MDNRRSSFLGRPAFAALLFGLGLALFGPPLLGIPAQIGGAALLIYLFTVWAGLIAALFARSRTRKAEARRPEPNRELP